MGNQVSEDLITEVFERLDALREDVDSLKSDLRRHEIPRRRRSRSPDPHSALISLRADVPDKKLTMTTIQSINKEKTEE